MDIYSIFSKYISLILNQLFETSVLHYYSFPFLSGYFFSSFPVSSQKGTRIIYDRKFLLECRRSPVAKTPPRGLPNIPGVTSPPSKDSDKAHNGELLNNNNITESYSNNTGMLTSLAHITGVWTCVLTHRT